MSPDEHQASESVPEADPGLASDLRDGLIEYVGDRLSTGEVLITGEQFQKAVEEGYRVLTGSTPDDAMKRRLDRLIASVHETDPALLLAPGVENWISLAVFVRVRKAGMGIADVQERGTQLIRDFLREPRTRALLDQLGLNPTHLHMSNCLRSVVQRVTGRADDTHKRATRRLARLAAAATAVPEPDREARIEALLEGPRALPDDEEKEARQKQEQAIRARLRRSQMDELVANLDNYVSLGRIRSEDAERLRQVHRVDKAMRAGTMARDQGSKIRNSILSGNVRDRIERSVKEALDYAVAYLQVFEALRRLETRFDPALRFLCRFGVLVIADAAEGQRPDLGPAVSALLEDEDTLRLLIDMMDRKDAEVRMIAVRLPPYSYVVKRDARVDRVAADESFVDELRTRSVEALSGELHSGNRKVRARPAAAMLSLVALIDRLVKPTPFRRELRLLKINLILEEFFHASDDVEQARQRARDFVRGRMRYMFPDLDAQETEELQKLGDEMIDRVEARVLRERAAAAPDQEEPREQEADEDGGEELSEDEKKQGIQIHRVSVRGSAGRIRQVPYKIMPDPEDGSRFVIAHRDPESGEMVPMLRRGAKRYVARGRDGTWALVRE